MVLQISVQNWSEKANLTNTISIFDLLRMVVPVNIDNQHWTSVHVDFPNKYVMYYDSMGSGGEKYTRLVMEYLKGEHLSKLLSPLKVNEWYW